MKALSVSFMKILFVTILLLLCFIVASTFCPATYLMLTVIRSFLLCFCKVDSIIRVSSLFRHKK